jgi:hypothetical protein
MKRIFLIGFLWSIWICSFGQILKIQVGTSLSSLDWKLNTWGSQFSKTLVGFSGSIGIDYFAKKNFNLSSNLGFLTKGGVEKTGLTDASGFPTDEEIVRQAKLNYVSFNTCIDLKYPLKEAFIPYLSVGPRIDYLISHSKEFDIVDHKNISYGLVIGAGIKYDISKVQFGLRGDYFLNFNKIAEWQAQPGNLGGQITDKTILISLTIGYKL